MENNNQFIVSNPFLVHNRKSNLLVQVELLVLNNLIRGMLRIVLDEEGSISSLLSDTSHLLRKTDAIDLYQLEGSVLEWQIVGDSEMADRRLRSASSNFLFLL